MPLKFGHTAVVLPFASETRLAIPSSLPAGSGVARSAVEGCQSPSRVVKVALTALASSSPLLPRRSVFTLIV
jgi:hypothetical protein